MKDVASELRALIDDTSTILAGMSSDAVSSKEQPGEWSKKEILGHLIDSAANNHQRFVRAASDSAAITRIIYSQVDWVRVQQYQGSNWGLLVTLWSAYNYHLCSIIEQIPSDALSARCDIGKEEPVTLAFVIEDYLRHIRHHVAELTAPPAAEAM